MTGNDNCRFYFWQNLPGPGNDGPIENLEDTRDPIPVGEGKEGGCVVYLTGEESADWQKC